MMQHSEPVQILHACRHLLRHIEDARALSSNDLAAPVFAEFRRDKASGANRRALLYIRNMLRLAANDLVDGPSDVTGRRRRDILLRCDLSGEPHKQVAAALGLSMRQFYRERRSLVAVLADILPERMRVRPSSRVNIVDLAALQLAHARSLQYGGDPASATALLRSIVRSAQSPCSVIEAWGQLATLLMHHSDFSQCRAELHAMRSYLAQCRPEGNDLDVCSERIALERRNLLERSGTIAEARASDRRRLARIIRFAQGDDSRGHDLAARALTAMARRDFACGDAKSARSHLEAVCAIGDLDEIAPDARIAFMVLYAVVLCTIGSDCGTASSLFSDAVTLCERYGLSELAVVAVLGRSIEEQMRGDPANALKQMHAVWPLAKRIASPLNYIHVCLRIAELEASLTPRAALSMIEEAQRLIRYRTYEWMCAELLTAEALAAAKDFAAAKVHAEHVVSVAAEEQNCALEGSALLVLAECYADLNAKSTAVEAIKAAIVRLERFGFPLKLLRAYRTAARLTGRSRYERYCNELALLHPA